MTEGRTGQVSKLPQERKQRTLVILAGGQSTRMGRDKTFLPYKHTTFLQYLIREAGLYFARVFVSAGNGEHAGKIRNCLGMAEDTVTATDIGSDTDANTDVEVSVIEDSYERIGPMGGLLSVFQTIGMEKFVLLAVDIPDADMHVLAELLDMAGRGAEAAVMLKLKDDSFAEACAAVYTPGAYPLLKASYERGEYSLRKAIGEDRIRYVGAQELKQHLPDISEERLRAAFRNINTFKEYISSQDGKVGSQSEAAMVPENLASAGTAEAMRAMVPEILAPAGTAEAMRAAVNAGCDAVYLGGELFGARAYAGNFDQQTLLETLEFCHLFGVKVYMTVNTLLKESEIAQLARYMEPYYRAGLDGVIVQDVGVIRVLRSAFPDLPLHASTQMSISSVYGAQLLKEQGLKRVVPARELTLKEIIAIRNQVDIEIETFVHGAMCYAYSGKCLFSSFLGGRSGNRGRCAQPCRQCYEMAPSVREYSMSMKDMCALSILPQMIDAGIHSFKIEGRMKNASYVAATVHAYRTARDFYLEHRRGTAPWKAQPESLKREYLSLAEDLTEKMQDIYNRGGFHTGYYFPDHTGSFRGEKGLSMISRTRPNHTGLRVGTIEKIRGSEVQIRLVRDIQAGDVLELLPAGIELTSSCEGKSGSAIWLKARELGRIKPGMEVYRTRNEAFLQKIDRDILQMEKKLKVKACVTARIGEPVKISISSIGAFSKKEGSLLQPLEISLEGDVVQPSQGRPVTAAQLQEKMNKTGGTHLEFQVECDVDEQAFIPMSRFNDLRRRAILQFKEAVCSSYHRSHRSLIGDNE